MSIFTGDEGDKEYLDAFAKQGPPPPEPEEIVLTRRLCRALDLDTIKTKLVALRVLTKCVRDGTVTRADLTALRDGPLAEAEVPSGTELAGITSRVR